MKLIADKVDAIILAIGVPLALLLGACLAHFVIVPATFPDDAVIMANDPNFTDVVAQSVKSVVHIRCPEWQGSGFIISEHMIGTARHVTDDVEDFEITLYDGTKIHAKRAISAKDYDVAVIWVDESLPKECIAELESIKSCKLGQDIFAVGSPYGYTNFNSVTKGIISGLNRDEDEIDPYTGEKYGWKISFTTDAAGHPGNSGCPIFSLDGKVRGILVGGYSPVLIICMPVDIFLQDLPQIKEMFLMDKYQFEEKKEYQSNDYYNHKDENEYY